MATLLADGRLTVVTTAATAVVAALLLVLGGLVRSTRGWSSVSPME